MSRLTSLLLLGMVVALAACSTTKPPLRGGNYRCVGMADDLKTLKKGDELPRIVQVMGYPTRAYRSYGLFGGFRDVLEYEVPKSACATSLLKASEGKLRLVFDAYGEYTGFGDAYFGFMTRLLTMRTDPLMIDPSVMRP